MNLLIVDDQNMVVNGLKKNLDRPKLGIDEIFTATSAKEARLIMMSFPVHILLTDIEMPQEDGLSLFRWTMEKIPQIVGIFLTSHADFSYAQEALRMGGFDYVLQPARIEEIEEVLKRAAAEVEKRSRVLRLEETREQIKDQREVVMELFLINAKEGNDAECHRLYEKLVSLYHADYPSCVFRIAQIKLVHFDKKKNTWDSGLVRLVFCNVMEELLADNKASVIAVRDNYEYYYLTAAAPAGQMEDADWERAVESFCVFLNRHMDFRVAVFAKMSGGFFDRYYYRPKEEVIPAVYWDKESADSNGRQAETADDAVLRVRKAEEYIRNHLNRSVSRTEVAEYLHINEDYFSRIFKKYTGYTFKDYDIRVRMETAKNLLEHTRLPVSMVAGKTGFDNFSHFSQTFKKYTGKTPSEFR